MIVHLKPPNLSPEALGEKILCTRPMREGRFNISLEHAHDKTIVNCYGHGGSGWTTLFGSVNKALSLYIESNPDKSVPIRIIGSGCMGLTAAVELKRRGYAVKGIVTKSLYDIASWKAGGYFALLSIKTSPDEQENLIDIGLDTFHTFQQIEQGMHPYLTKSCVRYLPLYCSQETQPGIEDLELRGLIPSRDRVTLDFGNGVKHENFLRYMSYYMDTSALMHQLTAEVRRLGIEIDIKEIRSFDEIDEQILFNCSGLGAKELNRDDLLIPVRGHLIMLNEFSGGGHMDYLIYSKVEQDGKEEYIYLFPKTSYASGNATKGCRGVLGGTFIVDTIDDENEFQRMLERNRRFFG